MKGTLQELDEPNRDLEGDIAMGVTVRVQGRLFLVPVAETNLKFPQNQLILINNAAVVVVI